MIIRDPSLMLGPTPGRESPETPLLELPQEYGIVEANLDRWSRAGQGHYEWAQRAVLATDFTENRQWTAAERELLRVEGRPCITKGYIAPLMRLLIGYFRQNGYDISVTPGTDGSGKQVTAETITHLIKMICEANGSRWNDGEVFSDGLIAGRGYWDLRLDFSKSIFGEINERVVDPFDGRIDPEAETYNPDGWGFWSEERWLSISDIFTLFGANGLDAAQILTDGRMPIVSGTSRFDRETPRPQRGFGLEEIFDRGYNTTLMGFNRSLDEHINLNRKVIRVVDCQHRVLKRVQYLVDLQTGMEKILPTDWPREKIQRVLQWAQLREVPVDIRSGIKKVVRWTTTAADRVLYDGWSPYDDFTIVPYFSYFRRGMTMGAVDALIDSQKEMNKRSSAMLHIVMTTANSGWLEEEGSLDELNSALLSEEGGRPGIRVKYKKGSTPPQKIQPSIPPTAMKMLVDQSEYDMKQIAGINDSALGNLDQAQSGKAILARQKQSAVGTEMYFDNFSRSKELKGRKIMTLIQSFYTEERIFRTVGDDGNDVLMTINQRNAAGEIANNVIMGTYEVVVDEAPMSASFQSAQFEEAIKMVQAGIPIPPDILVEMSSMPKKDEIKQRLKEQAVVQQTLGRVQAIGAAAQLGVQPGQPVPPVVDSPGVVTTPQQPPMASPQGELPLQVPPPQQPLGMPPLVPGALPPQ